MGGWRAKRWSSRASQTPCGCLAAKFDSSASLNPSSSGAWAWRLRTPIRSMKRASGPSLQLPGSALASHDRVAPAACASLRSPLESRLVGSGRASEPRMKILLVDDHSLITDALRLLLTDIDPDVQVFTAGDAPGAERLLDQHPDADLMLLDLGLPGASGTSAL